VVHLVYACSSNVLWRQQEDALLRAWRCRSPSEPLCRRQELQRTDGPHPTFPRFQ